MRLARSDHGTSSTGLGRMGPQGARESDDRRPPGEQDALEEVAMRTVADCRQMPSESRCTLTISGSEEEVLRVASRHAVEEHGHADSRELREEIAQTLQPENPGTALLRGGYEAFARGDVPDVLGRFTDDVVWSEPGTLPFGGTYQGKDAVAGFFAGLGTWFSAMDVAPEQYVEQGDTVTVLGHHRSTTAAGFRIDLPFVHVWTLRDGAAATFAEHVDTTALNAALALQKGDGLDTPRQRTADAH